MSRVSVRFLGHSAVALEHDGTTVLIDPFLTGNPKAADSAPTRWSPPTRSCSRTGTSTTSATRSRSPPARPVRASPRSSSSPPRSRVTSTRATTSVTRTSAAPSRSTGPGRAGSPPGTPSTTPKGTISTPAGIVVNIGGKTIYHLGDTALFSDLALPGRRDELDLAFPCRSAGTTRWIASTAWSRRSSSERRQIIPIHYDTFPPIETDAQAFKSDVQNAGYAEVVVLEPGEIAHAMTTAVVLIEAERDAMSALGGALADLDGVAEAYSVTGEWDFVAIIRVPAPRDAGRRRHRGAGQAPRRQPDPDDGRLRGLLAPRPRGDVLDRDLVAYPRTRLRVRGAGSLTREGAGPPPAARRRAAPASAARAMRARRPRHQSAATNSAASRSISSPSCQVPSAPSS